MDKIEAWASQEAAKRGVTTPHSIRGFKDGVRAAYETMLQAKSRKRMSFVPGGDPDDIFTELLRG